MMSGATFRPLLLAFLVAAALHPGTPMLAEVQREARPIAPAPVVDAHGKEAKVAPVTTGTVARHEKPKARNPAPRTSLPPPDEKTSGLGCAE